MFQPGLYSQRTTSWVTFTRRCTAVDPPMAAAIAPIRRVPNAANEVFDAAALASAAFFAVSTA